MSCQMEQTVLVTPHLWVYTNKETNARRTLNGHDDYDTQHWSVI